MRALFCSALILSLLLRHLPQIWIDLRNLRRPSVTHHPTLARGWFIQLCYISILIYCFNALFVERRQLTFLKWLGLGLVWFGGIIGILSLVSLRESYSFEIRITKNFKLITTGIYRVIRHPMRLGLTLEAIGLVAISGMPYLLFLVGVIVILQVIRTTQEEAFLKFHLGEPYYQYLQRVPAYNLFKGVCLFIFSGLAKSRTSDNRS